jgi:hypothetical protein
MRKQTRRNSHKNKKSLSQSRGQRGGGKYADDENLRNAYKFAGEHNAHAAYYWMEQYLKKNQHDDAYDKIKDISDTLMSSYKRFADVCKQFTQFFENDMERNSDSSSSDSH